MQSWRHSLSATWAIMRLGGCANLTSISSCACQVCCRGLIRNVSSLLSEAQRRSFLTTWTCSLQAPPPSYVPPMGASPMTWPNIYRNLKDIDYCVDQFDYVRYDSLGSPWPLSARTVIGAKLATNSAHCVGWRWPKLTEFMFVQQSPEVHQGFHRGSVPQVITPWFWSSSLVSSR